MKFQVLLVPFVIEYLASSKDGEPQNFGELVVFYEAGVVFSLNI